MFVLLMFLVRSFFVGDRGAALYILGCLVEFLVSTPQILVIPSQLLTIDTVSRHCEISPGKGGKERVKLPLVETPWHEGETVLFLRRKGLNY